MTVKELIEMLQKYDESDVVIIAKDDEGNAFSPLADVAIDRYIADNAWSGEIEPRSERAMKKNETNCVTLWPTC